MLQQTSTPLIIRAATPADIPQMQVIRNAVKENVLSNPALITDDDYLPFISTRGKGWVSENQQIVTGFAIADVATHNIWALFVHPDFEKQGIGRQLHDTMLHWYFQQTTEVVWLSTAPRSRAEAFYRAAGWVENGVYGKGEIKFEMTIETWKNKVSAAK